jgi:hypothetical protein
MNDENYGWNVMNEKLRMESYGRKVTDEHLIDEAFEGASGIVLSVYFQYKGCAVYHCFC